MDRIASLRLDPRVTVRRGGAPDPEGRCVVYWMQRAQRAVDNPALDVAVEAANALGQPIVTFVGIDPSACGNLRQGRFLVEGLPELAEGLRARRIGLVLRPGPAHDVLPFCREVRAALLVGDEDPQREAESRRRRMAEATRVPFWTVDADVIVPTRLLEKEQYAARTIRPRLHRLLPRFLIGGAEPTAKVAFRRPRGVRTQDPRADLLDGLSLDRSVAPVTGFRGGTVAGRARLRRFLDERLRGYAAARNRPERAATSELSPYLRFGHLGPRAIALSVCDARAPREDKEAFLEQLIVRRELAINFVRFNPKYDSLAGCERWARATLAEHASDERPVVYRERALESAETHDALWNAAQRQMVRTGFMHGYLRMYWAKKILEWTRSPEAAFAIAVRLDDRWLLDGRDPNGYAGVAWAIGGKHDRPWPPRPIYGTVRSMSAAARKFDAPAYIRENP